MAHFALLNNDNVVIELSRLNNDDIFFDGVESEGKGIEILTEMTGHSNWKKCSYNGTTRNCYPQTGFQYHADTDTFCAPQPHPNWILNDTKTGWSAPIPEPDALNFNWDESINGWYILPDEYLGDVGSDDEPEE